MARFHEAFRVKIQEQALEEMKSTTVAKPGGWTEAWARKIMENDEEEEEEILKGLHRTMLAEFGHAGAETMIEGVRRFVHDQRQAENRRKRNEQEERRRHGKRGEDESTGGIRGEGGAGSDDQRKWDDG